MELSPTSHRAPRRKVATQEIKVVMNDDYLPVLMSTLDQARTSIDILAFSFAIGSSAGVIATKTAPYQIALKLKQIKQKYKSKIKIRLFIEGYRETSDRNIVTAKFLEEAGVEVRYGATHAKGFCIDNRLVLFGSTNLTQQSILKNNETNLLIDDSQMAKGFEAYFMHLWNGGKHGDVHLPLPFIADGGFKDVIIKMIDSAKSRLEFSIYFFSSLRN